MPPRIGGYERLEEIGRGGSSVVYRARDKRHRRAVAIKVLQGGFDERHRALFERECEAMGLVSRHPGCVTVFDSGYTDDGAPYLVMEYLPEGSLQDRVDQGAIPWPEAIAIGVHLAGVLQTAHEAGVLHRDVKPDNVLISEFSEYKLSDFGIARLEGRTLTRTGPSAFTPMHAAPEVVDGGRASEASDVYSLGSTVYTLIAGSPPFYRETDESSYALIARVLWDDAPDLGEQGVPHDVSHALERALAKKPSERPESAAELGQMLQQAQVNAGQAMTPMTVAAPNGTAPATTPTNEAASEPRRHRSRLQLAVAGTCVVLAALLVVRIVVAVAGNDDDRAGNRTPSTRTTPPRPFLPLPSSRTTVEVGRRPEAVTIGDNAVWVTNRGSGTVSRIVPVGARGRATETIKVGKAPSGIALGHGAVWVANAGSDTVWRINPTTNRVLRKIKVGDSPSDLVAGADAVWVTNTGDGTVSRIEPSNNSVMPIEVGRSPLRVAIGASFVWVTNFHGRSVSRIDPLSNEVAEIDVMRRPMGLAADDVGIWITHVKDDRVSYVNANGLADPERVIRVGDRPTAVAINEFGDIWVANTDGDSVSLINTQANEVATTLRAGVQPYDIAFEGVRLWLTNYRLDGKVSRLTP